MAESGKEIFEGVYEALNAHDLDALDRFIAEDVVIHGMEAQGLQALKKEMRSYFEGVPDFHVKVEQVIAGGDLAGAWIVCGGTHTGNLWGMPATGRTLAVPELDLGRIENGKVVEYWVLSDGPAMMQQLGMGSESQAS